MEKWTQLSRQRRLEIFQQVSSQLNLPAEAVEKDWWVTATLRALFTLPIADHLVFKGGTSLSKCWGYLDRFSEDIDIAMDREFLGFYGELSKTQIKKLRKKSSEYVSTILRDALRDGLEALGIPANEFEVEAEEHLDGASDHDPQRLYVRYVAQTSRNGYLKDQVIVEIGSRSQMEPYENKEVNSFVDGTYPQASFSQMPFTLPAISPAKTFLEKILLLHEKQFQGNENHAQQDRISRHLYDLERLMDTPYALVAIEDEELFQSIITHRAKFTPIKGIDYTQIRKQDLDFIPHGDRHAFFERDYQRMRENMISGEALTFPKLLERLQELKAKLQTTTL
jgi:hypothetical protein